MNTFDYATYLKSKGIDAVGTAVTIDIIDAEFNILSIRQNLVDYIDKRFSVNQEVYLKLFILGINEIDDSTLQTENQLGITHLFAISGMHLGLIIGFLTNSLERLKVSNRKIKIVVVLFLILYNIVTGFRVSLLRASLLTLGVFIKDFFRLMLGKTDVMSFIIIGFLLVNPFYIYSLGFQLSFLVAFTLILGKGMLSGKNIVSRIVITTLMATTVSLPLTLSMNRELGLAFVYANLFFILYISYLFLPATLIVFIFPFLTPLYSVIVVIFEKSIEIFSKLNIIIGISFPNNLYKLLFWFILLWMFMNYKNTKRLLQGGLALLSLFLATITLNYESPVFVRFIDVGQGDAIHIHDYGCDLLIDTGDEDNYDNLVDYFLSYNIKSLDYIVLTHFHADHYMEIDDLVNNISVKKIYTSHKSDLIDYNQEVLLPNDSL